MGIRGKSKIRVEMGEERWFERKRQMVLSNTKRYQANNPEPTVNYKRNQKMALIEYKGGKCELCGYNKKCPTVFHFHHLDPTKKEFTVSKKSYSFEEKKKEVDKCQLLCSNCHAEIHDALYEQQRAKTIAKISS